MITLPAAPQAPWAPLVPATREFVAGALGTRQTERPTPAIDGRAGLVLALVEPVARLAQARQRCPGGVSEPARRVDEVRKRCAALALQQADDGGLLRWCRAPPGQG